MKYNIAISGTFNVENYGDLMFPVIFEKALKKRNIDFNLFLFSPEKTCKKASDESVMVYAIDEISKIHAQYPLDAIIVGGGALVHYNKISVKFPDEDVVVPYDICESWYYPIEFATRNNINLIFNSPQIPYQVPEKLKDVTCAAFDNCDYISLRDDTSKQYLIESYGDKKAPNINVFPDSVCCIADLISIDELDELRKNIITFDDKYAIIQFNPQKPQDDDENLVKIINKLKEQNLKVLLLPIGYTHGDDFILEKFNTENNTDCTIIKRKLNIFETAAVLSGCAIYIGSSFHGAITAIAYGKKAISYNYIYPKNKNKEIFHMYEISDFIGETAEEVLTILEKMLSGNLIFNPALDKVLNQVNDYFDNVCCLIKNKTKLKTNNYLSFAKPLINLLHEIVKLENDLTKTCCDLKMQEEYSGNLENIINQHLTEIKHCHEYISNLEKNNLDQDDYIKTIEAQISSLNLELASIKNSIFWKIISPLIYCLTRLKKLLKK